MLKSFGDFFSKNWLNLLLVFVGGFAFLIYILQERRKESEAASLIIMQVEDLQKRIRQIGSYIIDSALNDTAFYESQILYKTDYWDKYKHYFIQKLDSFSVNTFDEFYSCASEVKEQQELMKNLQKNFFFVQQQALVQMESNTLLQTFSSCSQTHVEQEPLIQGLLSSIPGNMDEEQKTAIANMMKQVIQSNSSMDYNYFWNLYNQKKTTILEAYGQSAFTRYTPEQISISLRKALKNFESISIIGCKGYVFMKKIAERKF